MLRRQTLGLEFPTMQPHKKDIVLFVSRRRTRTRQSRVTSRSVQVSKSTSSQARIPEAKSSRPLFQTHGDLSEFTKAMAQEDKLILENSWPRGQSPPGFELTWETSCLGVKFGVGGWRTGAAIYILKALNSICTE